MLFCILFPRFTHSAFSRRIVKFEEYIEWIEIYIDLFKAYP